MCFEAARPAAPFPAHRPVRRWRTRLAAALLVALGLLSPAVAQQTCPTQAQVVSFAAPSSAPQALSPGQFYGPAVLLPPLVTIVLAVVWRQVVPALAVGILVASYMLAWAESPGRLPAVAIGGLTTAVETFVVGALANPDHVKILLFTLIIGGMVGIIGANGGTPAVVQAVSRWASDRRRGQLATWLAGLLVFFDDYANAMIIGPAMRPVCDRLGISRPKLAYIVDTTAAPIASIALIGTWIGAEVGFIQDGLARLGQRPAFLAGAELDQGFAYAAFIRSIPYRFYPILALVLVFLIGLLDRDFGPMRAAEQHSSSAARDRILTTQATVAGKAWYAGVPVLLLVGVTLGLLVLTGWRRVPQVGRNCTWFELLQTIVSRGDPYNSILYGALVAGLAAFIISLATGTLSVTATVDSAMSSMSRMFPTIVVLVLAWALSATIQALELGQVAKTLLQQVRFDARWLPLLVFLAACGVSFATGTSWGTLGILCPATVTLAAGLLHDTPPDQAQPIFYASIGSVLAGAVFGDHCSPISDTTVLSALASECSLESHVWTQMPYALLVAAVSATCGEVLCRGVHWPAWAGLLVGAAALTAIVLLVGRKPAYTPTAAGRLRSAAP